MEIQEPSLIASLTKNDRTYLLSGNRVYNALLPQETGALLLARLETAEPKHWHFSYIAERVKIVIWPFLFAGGKDDVKSAPGAALVASLTQYIAHLLTT